MGVRIAVSADLLDTSPVVRWRRAERRASATGWTLIAAKSRLTGSKLPPRRKTRRS